MPYAPQPWFAFVLGYEGENEFRCIVIIPNTPDNIATSAQDALAKFDLLAWVDTSWDPNTTDRSVTSVMVIHHQAGCLVEWSEFSIEVSDRAADSNAEAIGIALTANSLANEFPHAQRMG